MASDAFRPVVYLKHGCPYCLKFMIFLSEGGLLDRFDLAVFDPGDDREDAIRTLLAPHFEKLSFPTVQIAPGQFVKESDVLIAHYEPEATRPAKDMVLLDYYQTGVLLAMGKLFRENMAFREKAA